MTKHDIMRFWNCEIMRMCNYENESRTQQSPLGDNSIIPLSHNPTISHSHNDEGARDDEA